MAYEGRSFFCILFVCCFLACSYTVLGQDESSGPVRCYFCMYSSTSTAYNVTRRKQTCVDGVARQYTQCERFCSTYAEYDANRTQVLFVYRSCAPDASNICAAGSGREPYCEVTCATDSCNAHNVTSIRSLGFIENAATIGTTLAPSLMISTTLFTLSRYFLGNM